MNKRNASFITIILSFIGLVIILSSFSHPPTPPQGCFQIDPASCGGDLTNAILNIDIRKGRTEWMSAYGHVLPYPDATHYIPVMHILPPVIGHIVSAGYGEVAYGENYVNGWEVNYGFWSKNSYRQYTWGEMFQWKYGRPPTAAELAALTCEQVKRWFIERHTVHRGWPFSDDPPLKVNCGVSMYKKYCMDLTEEYYEFSGYVQFPNGIKCEVSNYMTGRTDYSHRQNNTFKLKIVKPCAACQ